LAKIYANLKQIELIQIKEAPYDSMVAVQHAYNFAAPRQALHRKRNMPAVIPPAFKN
jgi:hypothetical protein